MLKYCVLSMGKEQLFPSATTMSVKSEEVRPLLLLEEVFSPEQETSFPSFFTPNLH